VLFRSRAMHVAAAEPSMVVKKFLRAIDIAVTSFATKSKPVGSCRTEDLASFVRQIVWLAKGQSVTIQLKAICKYLLTLLWFDLMKATSPAKQVDNCRI